MEPPWISPYQKSKPQAPKGTFIICFYIIHFLINFLKITNLVGINNFASERVISQSTRRTRTAVIKNIHAVFKLFTFLLFCISIDLVKQIPVGITAAAKNWWSNNKNELVNIFQSVFCMTYCYWKNSAGFLCSSTSTCGTLKSAAEDFGSSSSTVGQLLNPLFHIRCD